MAKFCPSLSEAFCGFRPSDFVRGIAADNSSVKYPAMGVTRYCWSAVAQISVTMTRRLKAEDRHERIQLTVCSVGRRAESSNRRWYVAEKEYL